MTLLLDGEHVRGRNPKTLTCSMMVRYADAADLRALLRLAETTGSGGQPKLYRIVNDTAKAFGVRQVKFSDGVSAREDDNLRAWVIQFTLSEHLSNPERVEQRRQSAGVNAQAAAGQSVGGSAAEDGAESGPELTGFEKTLKKLDGWLSR
jgi:hypothetical protein